MNLSKQRTLSFLLLTAMVCAQSALAASLPAISAATPGNVVDKSVAFVKDFASRFYEGIKQMRIDHQRCNQIREKQNIFRDELKVKWENNGWKKSRIRMELKKVNGGITFEEYAFLQKGKADRNKLMTLAFYSFSIRSMWPYLLWAGPDAFLPSKIRPMTQDEVDEMSRHRAHATMEALIDFERVGHEKPGFFGGDNKLKKMQSIARSSLLKFDEGPAPVLSTLNKLLYATADDKTKDNLAVLPKMITKGLAAAVSGKRQNFGIHFMRRLQVLNHIRKLKDADEFLVNHDVDLNTLSFQLLAQTCSDRCIGISGRTDGEMREHLKAWLENSTIEPAKRLEGSGFRFNGILARSALMSYYAIEGTTDNRSSSVLPRLLFNTNRDEKLSDS